MPPIRALCFTSHHTNLRAEALVDCLRTAGCEITAPPPTRVANSLVELLVSIVPNCWFALIRKGDIAVGFKPHLNVTLPLLICRLRGIPTWIDVDDLDHAYRSGLASRLIRWTQRPFPRLFHTVSYHNPRLAGFLTETLTCRPERLVQLHQGVRCERFSTPPAEDDDREALRRQLGLEGRRAAIYTAHLNVASDLDPVLVAWQRVARKVPDAVLLVVGGGSRLGEFRALADAMGIGARVVFTGPVAHRDVPRYFALAELAVLYAGRRLANEYRCSLKLREYLAAGLRVGCNDVGELADFRAFTYQSGSDTTQFANLLIRLFHGHGDGRELAAREYARTHLDWPIVARTVANQIFTRLGVVPDAHLPKPERPPMKARSGMLPELRRVFSRAELDTLILFVTNACNLRCWFCCYADNLNQTKDISHENLLRLSATMPRFRALLLSGGEPFIRPKLDEVMLAFVRNNGIQSIYIPTNGWYLDRTTAMCRSFLEQERDVMLTLSFSVDGLEETHDRIRTKGKKGSFAALCKTIETLGPWRDRYPNLRLRLNSVVTPDNIDEIRATVDYFHARFDLDEHALEIVRDLDMLRAHHDAPDKVAIADRYHEEVQYAYRRYFLERRGVRPQFSYLPDAVSHAATYGFGVACSRVKRDRIKGDMWPFACTAGSRIMVVSGSGSLSACEHRAEIADLREYEFDFARAMATGKMAAEVAQIAKDKCDCIHGCFVGNGLQHSPSAIVTRALPAAARTLLR